MGRNKIALACVMVFVLALAAFAAAAAEDAAPGGEAALGQESGPPTLSLDEAISLALEHNPQLAAVEEDISSARQTVLQAVAVAHAHLDVTTMRMTPVDLPEFSFQSPDSTWQTDFSLSQLLYAGGAVGKGIDAAKRHVASAQSIYERTRQQIAFKVRQAYYRVLTAEEQVQVSEEVVNSAKEHLRVARLRYDAGVAPEFDVLAAEAYVARVEQALIAAKTELSISREALNTVLGVRLSDDTRLVAPPTAEIPEVDPDTLEAEALAQRPDIAAARALVTVNEARVGVERAARKPTITAGMSYSLRPKTTIPGDLFGIPGSWSPRTPAISCWPRTGACSTEER